MLGLAGESQSSAAFVGIDIAKKCVAVLRGLDNVFKEAILCQNTT